MSRYTHRHLTFAYDYHRVSVAVRLVINGSFNLYHCLVGGNLRGCHDHTILSYMQGRHRLQPNMAIDARSGVPSAVGLL